MFASLIINSPVGQLTLVADDQALLAVMWKNYFVPWLSSVQLTEQLNHPILQSAQQQLNEYFVGQRHSFTLPLAFTGTEFQQKVWQALLHIPYGETRSYQQIAQAIQHPHAARAVGAANAKNPLSIIVPCHRVIGANGQLTGFTGGVDKKSMLLNLECAKD